MPHFYFHIRKYDDDVEDNEGVDLPDMAAAREEAVMTIRELTADEIRTSGKVDLLGVEIFDGNGQSVLTIRTDEAITILG